LSPRSRPFRFTAACVAALLTAALPACTEYSLAEYDVLDVYNQDPTEQVDILLMVDNSGSMLGYQLLLGARFPEFISAFVDADVDYHIGVVTTTVTPPYPSASCTAADIAAIPAPGELAGGRYLTTTSPGAEQTFRELVSVGACGSGNERGLDAARLALSPDATTGVNYGFLRSEAALSVIFVSDEQDSSTDPVSDYVRAFYDVKGQRDRGVFNASALVVTDPNACIVAAPGSSAGTRYMAVAERTGGVVANLCRDNFADVVRDLSLNASRVRDTFFLSEWPDPTSLQVTVDDVERPCGGPAWHYDVVTDDGEERPALVFGRGHLPLSNSRIAARYNRGSGDPTAGCTPQESP